MGGGQRGHRDVACGDPSVLIVSVVRGALRGVCARAVAECC